MTYVDVHVQALEECGRQVRRVRNMLDFEDAFVDSSVKKPVGDTESRLFGRLAGAGALADQVDAVWKALKDELKEGRERLKTVERALGEVATNFRDAETGVQV
ncbi:hypothetical protein ACI2LC_34580 [Nonomuraea wenchangensis]|uniref:Excreted virulence factor EspC, type VII ESX diderm n=1 Tax=Nonomuraea wenchangensis TaxID=568860 RepID=A0A1I0LAN1_9ACTN|nr:hypothetical protein [Nonomuraea wenchangensis]SEU36842.1 hypothetical protein SAMN05421811_11411 [Nonomuraea wenchangensis]